MMKKAALSTLLAAALLAALPSFAAAQSKTVNVYNWSDYVDETVLAQFTKETGIKVVYDVYDSNDVLETKVLSGKSGYDVVAPSASNLARQIAAGAYQKLDKAKLPNLSHMWPEISERLATYDKGNEYAVNYMWGTTGIGYNVEMIKKRMGDAPLNSWDLIFKPEVVSKFKDCGIYVLDSSDDMLPPALLYLGLNPNSHDPADLEKAGALLKTIRPNIRKFHSSEYINALANGDICLAVGYSGDILQARDRAAGSKRKVKHVIAYSIPKEGALMWFDSFVIPKDARNADNAHAFINFMMRPEVAAKNSNFVNYANGNKDSIPLLNKEVREDPGVYPDDATLKKLFTTTAYEPAVQRVATRIWTEVKSRR
jgi:putrescine transport system substrate-binding protein